VPEGKREGGREGKGREGGKGGRERMKRQNYSIALPFSFFIL